MKLKTHGRKGRKVKSKIKRNAKKRHMERHALRFVPLKLIFYAVSYENQGISSLRFFYKITIKSTGHAF